MENYVSEFSREKGKARAGMRAICLRFCLRCVILKPIYYMWGSRLGRAAQDPFWTEGYE